MEIGGEINIAGILWLALCGLLANLAVGIPFKRALAGGILFPLVMAVLGKILWGLVDLRKNKDDDQDQSPP